MLYNVALLSCGPLCLKETIIETGTVTYQNWQANISGEKLYQTLTYRLVSDSNFDLVRTTLGPYTLRKSEEDEQYENFYFYYLDIAQHLIFRQIPDNRSTNDDKWHGGTGSDEISALFSLQFGCKLKSAGFYTFKPTGDNHASPAHWIRPFGWHDDGIQIYSFPNLDYPRRTQRTQS
jgi:hypothetical protein